LALIAALQEASKLKSCQLMVRTENSFVHMATLALALMAEHWERWEKSLK